MTRIRQDTGFGGAEAVRFRAGQDDAGLPQSDIIRRRGVVHHLGLEQRGPARLHRADLVAKVFETAIVPELAERHGGDLEATPRTRVPEPIPQEERAQLTALARVSDLAGCIAVVESLIARQHSFSAICLGALGGAAADLGQMWSDDRCSFVEVTAGLGTLHIVLEQLSTRFLANVPVRNRSRRILLASLSGEQHSFGLTILGDLFRQAGWDVTIERARSPADIAALVHDQWFAIAGLSVAADERAPLLEGTIHLIREGSLNPHIGVMVGGQALLQHPELAEHIGADISACDGDQAVLRAEGLRLLLDHGPEVAPRPAGD